jgi:hypothetical protein
MIAGVAVASMGLMVADYFWLRHQARQRHERRHQQAGVTNPPASDSPQLTEKNRATNHE